MKRLTSLLFTLLIFVFFSCENDPCIDITCNNNGICIDGICECPDGFEGKYCEEQNLLLKHVYIDGVVSDSYEYLEDGRISKASNYLNGDPYRIVNFRYAVDTIILDQKFELFENIIQRMYYRIGLDQIRADLFSDGLIVGDFSIYSLFESNCGYTKVETFLSEDVVRVEKTIEIIDENCSFESIEVDKFQEENMHFIKTLNDDKNYYKKSTDIMYLSSPNRGNPLCHSVKDVNNNVNESFSFSSIYTYNENDFPSSEKRTYFDGRVEERKFEYY